MQDVKLKMNDLVFLAQRNMESCFFTEIMKLCVCVRWGGVTIPIRFTKQSLLITCIKCPHAAILLLIMINIQVNILDELLTRY